jgi:thermolabile hemolysin
VKKILFMGLTFLTIALVGLAASRQAPHSQTTPSQNAQPQNAPRYTAPTPSPRDTQIDRLYIFGDSLSDDGNVFRATGGAYPPNPAYFKGRYSNGPVWVEQLASKLGLSADRAVNLAYGGATTANAFENGVPGVLGQVQQFIKTHPQGDPKALYVVWGGANDYLSGAADPTSTVDNLSTAIELLSKTGAKRFLVANLPDLGRLPSTRNTSTAQSLTNLTNAHNAYLSQALKSLKQTLGTDTEIATLDVNGLYREAIATPAKFGFTNVTNACLNNAACTQPNGFLFWDGIHPTTKAHQLLANNAFATLEKTAQVSSKL